MATLILFSVAENVSLFSSGGVVAAKSPPIIIASDEEKHKNLSSAFGSAIAAVSSSAPWNRCAGAWSGTNRLCTISAIVVSNAMKYVNLLPKSCSRRRSTHTSVRRAVSRGSDMASVISSRRRTRLASWESVRQHWLGCLARCRVHFECCLHFVEKLSQTRLMQTLLSEVQPLRGHAKRGRRRAQKEQWKTKRHRRRPTLRNIGDGSGIRYRLMIFVNTHFITCCLRISSLMIELVFFMVLFFRTHVCCCCSATEASQSHVKPAHM